MEAPYTASESKIKTEDVRDAIYEVRTKSDRSINDLWSAILQVKKDLACDVRGLWITIIVLFIGCIILSAATVKSFNNVTEDMVRVREGFAILGLHDAPADAPTIEFVVVNPAPT